MYKTYIMTMENQGQYVDEKTSRAVESCNRFGYPYELIYGPTPDSGMVEVAEELGVNLHGRNGTDCCNMSHMMAMVKIIESGEPGVIMEYDGYWDMPISDRFKPSDMTVHQLAKRWGEGYLLTPVTASAFVDFRRSQKTIDIISDHLVHSKSYRGMEVQEEYLKNNPDFVKLHEGIHWRKEDRCVKGNENAKKQASQSVRRKYDGEINA